LVLVLVLLLSEFPVLGANTSEVVVMEAILPTSIATAVNIKISFICINNGVTQGLLSNVVRMANYQSEYKQQNKIDLGTCTKCTKWKSYK
jgi:hypothetical protein